MKPTYSILIADDSIVIQDYVCSILEQETTYNFDILRANNGREACSLAFKYKPNIIIIDIEMPVMNGIDAIRKIKENQLISNIPIIIFNALSELI